MKLKVVSGLAVLDPKYPDFKLFDDAVNEAIVQFYIPVFGTFRVTPMDGNVLFSILAELVEDPKFITQGGGDAGLYH
jgi:hypothetical protein